MDSSSYKISGHHYELFTCLQKQEGSPKCITHYIQIIIAERMTQSTIQSHAQSVSTENNLVLLLTLLLGWRKSADTID